MTISNRDVIDEFKQAGAQGSGQQLGGGPGASDQDAAGGSSGTGGYGNAQNQAFHQGQTGGPDQAPTHPSTRELSRGERYDMEQGGGRADDAVDFEEELKEDQQEHQDRGQRWLDDNGDLDQGAVTEGQQP
jgi:hypothetical protein